MKLLTPRTLCSIALLAALTAAAALRASNRNAYPLPEDRGTAGVLKALGKLPVYVRVAQITAHPDDESAGTLVWLTRKMHARTALFSLTRGEGGQNILGAEKYEAMGLLRTGELLEACRYYGVELYFSTAFDFGFSKTAEETLAKWGRNEILEEMVRFIRSWRPTIIISKFDGTARDGHGHHQAAGILTREAYDAAADPGRFPEHASQLGLAAWKVKKLYYGSTRSVEAAQGLNPGAERYVQIPSGDYDPVLGLSYREIGSQGYGKHRSQGNGAAFSLPGRGYDLYRLMDPATGSGSPETTFFDSLDTSLPAIAGLAGDDRQQSSILTSRLSQAQRLAGEALAAYEARDVDRTLARIAEGAAILDDALIKTGEAQLPKATKDAVMDALREKREDFSSAANAVLGIYLVGRAEDSTGVPGETVNVTAYFYNRGDREVLLNKGAIQVPPSWKSSLTQTVPGGKLAGGGSAVFRFSVRIDPAAAASEPFWYRENQRQDRYRTRPTPDIFAPFAPPEMTASVSYSIMGREMTITAPVQGQTGDPIRGADFDDFLVVPPLSVSVAPERLIVPAATAVQEREIQVTLLHNGRSPSKGTLRINAPTGWQIIPPRVEFSLNAKGETSTVGFKVRVPPVRQQGAADLEAVAALGNAEYRRGYRVVSYPENWTRNIYSPSVAEVKVFDVKAEPGMNVGYVMGAGDDIPAALEQLGMKVEMLSPADLAHGNLNRFNVIVTGIRAYNVNEHLMTNNRRLLEFVERGGRLIVQYNQPLRGAARGEGASFPYGPYPMTMSSTDRITVEDSPVNVLDPRSPVFNVPNKITAADFEGWVQERGLYFMSRWDARYTPLLSGHDPGEQPSSGGLLVARYGKGWYIYTAYAWFRQLPAGVPGAYRLFANILSLK